MPSTETVYNSASILVPIAINQTALNLGVREAILFITDFVGQDLSSTELGKFVLNHVEPQLGTLGEHILHLKDPGTIQKILA